MKRESAMPLRAALAAVALTFATLQASPAPAEEHCPKGDLPIAGTVEGRAKRHGTFTFHDFPLFGQRYTLIYTTVTM